MTEGQVEGFGEFVDGGEVEAPLVVEKPLDRIDRDPGLFCRGIGGEALLADRVAERLADRHPPTQLPLHLAQVSVLATK